MSTCIDSAGVFIGKFPASDGFEYRVAHANGIDPCDAMFPPQVADLYRVLYYGASDLYATLEDAQVAAEDIEERYYQHVDPERGVCIIEYDRPLADLSPATAGEKLDEYFMEQEYFV